METFWTESDYFTGPALTQEAIANAEHSLGVQLPEAYLNLLRSKNGGSPRRTCFPTSSPTSWASNHIAITGIRGIGGKWGIDSPSLGSVAMIREWGYPNIGVVVAECPSGGHDVVILDYSICGPGGEPRVVHVEAEASEPIITVLVGTFGAFLEGLRDESEFCD